MPRTEHSENEPMFSVKSLVWRTIPAIACLLLFFGLKFWQPFATFWPWPWVAFGSAFVLLFLLLHPFQQLVRVIGSIKPLTFYSFIGLTSLVTSTIFAYSVLGGIPHVTDSTAYLWQAKTLASGQLFFDSHPLAEFFNGHFLINDGRYFSIFPPGWPLLLALGVLIHSAWLVNPIIGTATLLLACRWASRLFGEQVARLTALLGLASPFFLFMSASFMSHISSAFLTLLALERAHAWTSSPNRRNATFVGIALGILVLTRPFNGLLTTFAVAVLVLFSLKNHSLIKSFAKSALFVIVPLVLCASLLLAYNRALTGDWLTFPQDQWFEQTEEHPDCHRLGFGETVGCAYEHGRYGFPDGYYLKDAWDVTEHRMASLRLNLYGWPIVLLMLPLSILFLPRRRLFWLWVPSLAVVGGYFFFYYHGNCYGPRFYFEALFPWLILMSATLISLHRKLSDRTKRPLPRKLLAAFVPAFVVGTSGFSFAAVFPSLIESYSHFRGIDDVLGNLVTDLHVHHAVVLIPGSSVDYCEGLNFQTTDENPDVIFARHWMDGSSQLMYWYPTRRFYRYNWEDKWLHELRRVEWNGIIFFEGEQKWPVFSPKLGHAIQENTWVEEGRHDFGFSGSRQLRFEGEGPGASFTLQQWVFEEAEYRIKIRAGLDESMGIWQLSVDDQPVGEPFDAYGESRKPQFVEYQEPILLSEGMHTLTFTVQGHNERSKGYDIGVDLAILRQAHLKPPPPRPYIRDKR